MDNNQHITELKQLGNTTEHSTVTKTNPIELRSQEIDAILGRTPSRLIRSGIIVIFGVMLTLFIGTVFFAYPDVIQSHVIITSSNPPVHLIAQASGRIHRLLVTNHQKVEQGQLLAILESTADITDILLLEAMVDSIRKHGIGVANTFFYQHLILGDVTPNYLEFRRILADYKTFETLRYHHIKMTAIEQQIALNQQFRHRLNEQLSVQEEDLVIELRNFERDSAAFHIRAISFAEMDHSRSRLLQKRHSLISAKIALNNAQIQLNQLQTTNFDLQTDYYRQKRQLTDNISSALDGLNNQLALWKNNFTFRSPKEGVVSFTNVWSTNQTIFVGEPVMSILPLNEEKIIGRLWLPITGSGKIKAGQNVVIKLDNFPFMEFGIVRGIITSISLVPINDMYIADVELTNGLTSNYGNIIPFNQEMRGTADIIIEDMSLFERFIQPVRSAIKRR